MACLWYSLFSLFRRGEVVHINERTVRIRKRLGDGQFGCVYLVREKSTAQLYAMKRIVCHSAADRERVDNEIKVHQMVNGNVNILSCEDFATAAGTAYESLISDKSVPGDYAMPENNGAPIEYNILLPYFKRGTIQEELRWRLAAKDFMKEARVWKLFRDICNGLNALHALPEPFVHGDLKAANVLLSDDDRAVLMDFGSARPAQFHVKTEAHAREIQDYAAEHCSMYYRAPELFSPVVGSVLDQRTDIWSLGCLLYAMCFWVSPFEESADRGDSLPLIFLSLKYRIPSKSPYSKSMHDLIRLLLEVDFTSRPFMSDVIDQLDKMNTAEGCI